MPITMFDLSLLVGLEFDLAYVACVVSMNEMISLGLYEVGKVFFL